MNALRNVTAALVAAGVIATAGCDALETVGPVASYEPQTIDATYSWVFQRFEQNVGRGYGVVNLTWELPTRYSDEVFRVYSRNSSAGGYFLIATVTSCSAGECRYGDTNIVPGTSYDYYVATVDSRSQNELAASEAIRIDVPTSPSLAIPAPSTVSLDGAVYVRWASTGAERYMILAQPESGSTFLIGETDGTSFFDSRAQNGTRYRYFVAGVDEFGQVSRLSQGADAFPRPDFHADVVYAHGDDPARSGFRFVNADTEDPVVSGTSTAAQWRLEASGSTLRIVPLGQTRITAGTFTTQLSCGPGSESNCVDVRTAPATDTPFGFTSVVVETGFTYILRTIGTDNRVHYAKLRVTGTSVDSQSRRLVVFDWAYQIRPEEKSLVRIAE